MYLRDFQHNCINKWNEHSNSVGELIIPKVMMHDKICADGSRKYVIELLTLYGILIKSLYEGDKYKWVLSEN